MRYVRDYRNERLTIEIKLDGKEYLMILVFRFNEHTYDGVNIALNEYPNIFCGIPHITANDIIFNSI